MVAQGKKTEADGGTILFGLLRDIYKPWYTAAENSLSDACYTQWGPGAQWLAGVVTVGAYDRLKSSGEGSTGRGTRDFCAAAAGRAEGCA